MIIIPPSKQAGAAGKTGSQFTGDVFAYLTMPSTDGVVINTVSFTPCARTHWHSHEKGQILIVLAGQGLIQSDGGPVSVIRAGDTIWAPGRTALARGLGGLFRHTHRYFVGRDLLGRGRQR